MGKPRKNRKLQAYIRRLVQEYGTQTVLADKIGMTLSAFSRAVNEEGTFSFENCLRLADAFGDDPLIVLRVAGKYDQADLFQRVRGGKVASLRAKTFLETKWSKLTREKQDTLDAIAEAMVIAEMYHQQNVSSAEWTPGAGKAGASSLSSANRTRTTGRSKPRPTRSLAVTA